MNIRVVVGKSSLVRGTGKKSFTASGCKSLSSPSVIAVESDRVKVLGKNAKGEVAFVGDTHFSDGVWLGISLDEPKGRNNGTVEGIRYFKCPRNHGVFVRACQIEKECTDNSNGTDKTNKAASSRIAYPNYLKSSSKIKCEKHLCFKKNDIRKTKSQVKSLNNSSSETVRTSNVVDKSTELQVVKQENEDLKKKLEETEKSFQDILEKYNKAMVEIKQMSEDLDSKKKQIKAQKFNLKLLKMRQCNHYKKIDSFKTSGKKSCQMSNDRSFDELTSLVEGDSNFSDDELDPQSILTLSSLKRAVELEEQNRIMIEGLVELRGFLMSQSKPQGTENLNHKNEGKFKRKHFGSLSNSSYSTASIKSNTFPTEEPESDIQDYRDVLRKMIKFTEVMKERGQMGKESASSHSIILHESGDCTPDKKEQMSIGNAVNQLRHFANPSGSDFNTKQCTDMSAFENGPESLQHSLVFNKCGFQSYLQIGDDLYTEKSYNAPCKMKVDSRLNNVGDTDLSNTLNFENQLKDHMTPVAPKSRETSYCTFDSSITKQKSMTFKVDHISNYNSEELEYHPELHLALSSHSGDMSFQ